MKQHNEERDVLKVSVYGALLFAIAGILMGLIIQSQVILFDGLYSLISLALSLLSLYTAKYIETTDWNNYPFGKDKIEPLVVLIKYFVILVLVSGSIIGALFSIISGGREVNVDSALLYSIIATIICAATAYYLKTKANNHQSALLKAESNQWSMDTVVSIGVLVGFLLSYLLNQIETLRWTVPYIDPLMVIIFSGFFIKVPIIEMSSAIREVLDMKPKGKISQQITSFMDDISTQNKFEECFVRISKVGQTLWVDVDFVVSDATDITTIAEQDEVREEINEYLDQFNYEKWLTVSFTEDRKWAL